MKNFDYVLPQSVEEFQSIIKENKNLENIKIFAGGTDILMQLRKKIINPEVLVNIKKIKRLKYINKEDNFLTLGPLIKIAEIYYLEEIKELLPLLHDASRSFASPLIRNIATIGGNICNASPAGDMIPPLMCYEAELKSISLNGEKRYKLEEFFVGPGKTKLDKGELVSEIIIPLKPGTFTSSFKKFGYRKALEISVASVAILIEIDDEKKIKDIKIAIGSVAPYVFRLREAEELIIQSGKINNILLEKVSEIAIKKARPIDDIRASHEYRLMVLKTLLKRAIIEALSKKGVNSNG